MDNNDIYDAIKSLKKEYIPFPPFDVALKAIIEIIELYRRTGIAERIRILGESGTGKSTLCDWIKHKYPRKSLIDRDVLPALVVSMPPAATISSVAEAMLSELGDPSPLTGNVSNKTKRVATLCKACKVEVILFDEAQHIYDRGKQATHYMVGDWLKSLVDNLAVPTVFLGLPRLELLLQSNEQLRRRFSKRFSLALGQSGDISLEEECFQLFQTLSNGLTIPVSFSPYSWKELGTRLAYASDGRVHYIKDLLVCALEIAMKNEETQICPALMEQAFTERFWWEGVGALNPFNSEFEFRKLDRGGEPFQRGVSTSKRDIN